MVGRWLVDGWLVVGWLDHRCWLNMFNKVGEQLVVGRWLVDGCHQCCSKVDDMFEKVGEHVEHVGEKLVLLHQNSR